MSEMIDKVARALCCQHGCEFESPDGALDPDGCPMRECFALNLNDKARRALEAMREPTPEMIEAGWMLSEEMTPAIVWKRMIDEAKA